MRTPPGFVSMDLNHRALILLRMGNQGQDIRSTFQEGTESFSVIIPRDLWVSIVEKRQPCEDDNALVYRLFRKEGDDA